ncbi:hypothetical protein ANRL1_02812 [Anaerolineae bacterium]|nr:hypothetical protein ANRL1_02812 [Anaerolineae bacterium]
MIQFKIFETELHPGRKEIGKVWKSANAGSTPPNCGHQICHRTTQNFTEIFRVFLCDAKRVAKTRSTIECSPTPMPHMVDKATSVTKDSFDLLHLRVGKWTEIHRAAILLDLGDGLETGNWNRHRTARP